MNNNERCHRRTKMTDKRRPTAYSHCRVSINATGCLAWEEERSLDVQFKGVHAGVVDDDVDILIEREQLYKRPWESKE
jgi:hypothetical protein